MSANFSEAIKEKLTKLAESAPKSKITIICEGEVQAQIDAVVSFAQELGLEVSVEKRNSIVEALEKTEKAFADSFQIVATEEMVERFEREVNALRIEPKPIVMESSKQFLDKKKSMRREHMKQMQRYQNKHWKK